MCMWGVGLSVHCAVCTRACICACLTWTGVTIYISMQCNFDCGSMGGVFHAHICWCVNILGYFVFHALKNITEGELIFETEEQVVQKVQHPPIPWKSYTAFRRPLPTVQILFLISIWIKRAVVKGYTKNVWRNGIKIKFAFPLWIS